MIVLRALGAAEIDTGVTTLTPSQDVTFAVALYLTLERGKYVSRDRLASLLWPNTGRESRAHRLRQAILQLKKYGFFVWADRARLLLGEYDAQSDIDNLSTDRLPDAAIGNSLEFLPGYAPRCSELFRDWVDTKRIEVHTVATRVLVQELERGRSHADWPMVEKTAAKCLSLDPFNETAVLAQAEAVAMLGGKRKAVDMLDRYVSEMGADKQDLRVPAALLRKRISHRMVDAVMVGVRECSLVGRDKEWEALTLQLSSATKGAGGACLIAGDAGIGKSRLASELAKFASLQGFQTCKTACRRSDVERPLSAFVDLVPQLDGLPGALGCSQETIAILRRLTEFDGRTGIATSLTEDSAGAYGKTCAALIDLVDAVADEQPLLITLEDVQWLDRTSIRLLAELFRLARTKQMLFVITERSGLTDAYSLAFKDDVNVLKLEPLRPSYAKALVGEILNQNSRQSDRELVQRLMSVGEGNPFFLQELGSHWLETGQQQEIPPSITAIIDDRLARLSSEALQVLQTCAVLGVNASIERIERVLEYKPHVLLTAVQELSVAGMLRTEAEASSEFAEQLMVRHDLVSTAATRRLAKAPLAFLHRRAGTILEQETLGDGARTSVLWACAFHWRNAGDRERAFRAARSCADYVLELGLPHDAANAFEVALGYCVTDEERLLVFSRLAVALQMNGQWEQSKDVLRKSRQLQAKTAPKACTHDDVEFALFEARWRVSLENSALLTELEACTQSGDAPVSHRVACGLLGLKLATELNRLELMKKLFVLITPLLEDPRIPGVTKFEAQTIYHSTCGDFVTAARATNSLLEAARAEKNPSTASRALGNVAVAYRLAGRKEDAEAMFREVLSHSLAHGLKSRTSFAALSLVRVHLAAGELVRARTAMQEFEASTDDHEDLHRAADRLYLFARLALEEGNMPEATSRYAEVAAQSNPNQSVNRRAAVLALGIRVGIQNQLSIHLLRPMVDELRSAHLRNRGSGWQDFEAHALAIGLRACGESERSLLLLGDYVRLYRREKWPIPQNLRDLLTELGEATPSQQRAELSLVPAFSAPMTRPEDP